MRPIGTGVWKTRGADAAARPPPAVDQVAVDRDQRDRLDLMKQSTTLCTLKSGPLAVRESNRVRGSRWPGPYRAITIGFAPTEVG